MIRTAHIYPPIPIRSFDWQATYGDWDLGDPIGSGPTEVAAVADLIEQLDDDKAALAREYMTRKTGCNWFQQGGRIQLENAP